MSSKIEVIYLLLLKWYDTEVCYAEITQKSPTKMNIIIANGPSYNNITLKG